MFETIDTNRWEDTAMMPRQHRRETTPRREPVRVPQTVPQRPNPERPTRPATPVKPQPVTPGK